MKILLSATSPLKTLATVCVAAMHTGGRKTKASKEAIASRIDLMVAEAAEILCHEPMVADLGPTLRRELCAGRKRFSAPILKLWRFAGELGLIDRIPQMAWGRFARSQPLSEKNGTLWNYCLDGYFLAQFGGAGRTERNRREYEIALKAFREGIGHEPTRKDLCESNLSKMRNLLTEEGLATKTVRYRVDRIRAIWKWLANRGVVAAGEECYES